MARDASEVVVVSGLPRTGTSMMMAMLEAGGVPPLTDRVRAPDEDNRRGYWEYEPVKALRDGADWLPQARGHAVKIIAMLLQHLPEDQACAVLLMRRHLDEVLASQRQMLQRRGRPGGRLSEADLRTLYQRQYDQALAWGRRTGSRVLEVDYNALVIAPRPWVAQIDTFLGGGLDRDAMQAVVEPDLHRQRADAPSREGHHGRTH
ncbi:MAG: sulfotransferase [Phycisphaerales bacterium]|nr:sulfotransferase [Phycisphaerales bacterium]